MGVDVRCPACHTHTRVPPDAVGRNIRCKKCHHPFIAKTGDGSAVKLPPDPESKKRLFLFLAAGLFVLLVAILIILRVTGVF